MKEIFEFTRDDESLKVKKGEEALFLGVTDGNRGELIWLVKRDRTVVTIRRGSGIKFSRTSEHDVSYFDHRRKANE